MATKAAKKAAGKKKAKKAPTRYVEEQEDDELEEEEEVEEVEEEVEEEEEPEEVEEEEEEEEVRPRKKGKRRLDDDVQESRVSVEARRRHREAEDIQRYHKRKTRAVTLIATEMGFDGEKRVRPGAKFIFKAPLDDEGRVILPRWAVLERDYEPPEPVRLPPGMKPKTGIQGGASQGGVKPKL